MCVRVVQDFQAQKLTVFVLQNEENAKKYEEFNSFISRIGVCRALSSCDIVQFGLAECKSTYTYKQAERLAKHSTKQYFEYL